MTKSFQNINLYLGPMSKNIVDGIIDYNTNVHNLVGITASRRQIDYHGGYSNNWKTNEFAEYVKGKNPEIVICRDHGGIGQGSIDDDGFDSFLVDAKYMDIIHIDPFKKLGLDDSIDYTIRMMKSCLEINTNLLFEIGTEQSIYEISPAGIDYFLHMIKSLVPELFSKILYVVIQSGTSLRAGINTGEYSRTRLLMMIDVCKNYNVLSKEHNGDYLTPEVLKNRFKLGVSAINIAPELAHIEAEFVLNNMSDDKTGDWFDLCMDDGRWRKWFPDNFNPYSDQDKVLLLCGHYVFTNPDFLSIFDLDYASEYVRKHIHNFINERITNESRRIKNNIY